MTLTTNLLAYYSLQGNSNDATGNGNTGSDVAITYSTGNGKIGQGAGFNGSSSQITAASTVIPLGAKTVAYWMKCTNTAAIETLISSGRWDTTADGLGSWHYSGASQPIHFAVRQSSVIVDVASASAVNTGSWVHVACTWDGTTGTNSFKVYFNGSLEGQGTPSSTETVAATGVLTIGAMPNSGNTYWYGGAFDEIGIWSRALSATEISQLYNGGSGLAYPLISPSTGNFLAFM